MTPDPFPGPMPEGVTRRRSRSAGAARPGDAARAQRYTPPTAAEVGRAAALCFQDTRSDEQIARQLGIVRRTLARWKRRSEFVAAIAALQVWHEILGKTPATSEAALAAPRGQDAHDRGDGISLNWGLWDMPSPLDARPRLWVVHHFLPGRPSLASS